MLKNLKPRVAVLDTRTSAPPPKTSDSIYSAPQWRMLIARIIDQRGRRCEGCGRTGCRIYGDHIVELKDGGAQFDRANVKLLCGSCHGKKTITERAKRLAASHAAPATGIWR